MAKSSSVEAVLPYKFTTASASTLQNLINFWEKKLSNVLENIAKFVSNFVINFMKTLTKLWQYLEQTLWNFY